MKSICLFSVSLLILLGGCRTSKSAAGTNSRANTTQVSVAENLPAHPDFSDPKTWLIGYFDPGKLSQEPYSEWYKKGYDDYQFNTEAVNQLIDKDKSGISIKVIMGTWCPDSRREIPRLMRILDIWQFPASNLTFIGVDDAKNSPVAEYNKLDIQKVPTIIIYKNNVEAGRIIEIPVTSLEQDMVKILGRNE
jgi:thiol-disulfide isomerase/thioredoxin